VHEVLVGSDHPKLREVAFDLAEIVNADIWVSRTVGVGVDKSLHAKVVEQPFAFGVSEVVCEHTWTDMAAQGPGGEEQDAPQNAYRYLIVQRSPSVQHDD
jgi:hypothetical protein